MIDEALVGVGKVELGVMSAARWMTDPRTLLFTLSRYKFAAKMLAGRKHVLEVGCGDGFASRIVRQTVGALTLTDFDPEFIGDFRKRSLGDDPRWYTESVVHDLATGPVPGVFDGAYCLDVLEHVETHHEDRFVGNLTASLTPDALVVIGMPSLESQSHASPQSKEGHVNCKTGEGLRETLGRHFAQVLSFSMNDEVVHTGFEPMAHYLLAVCSQPRVTEATSR
jgi:2-polyprenyl-3-methyl-5-hydroxy-6-metoxy-1,4-benzoquinol methylase